MRLPGLAGSLAMGRGRLLIDISCFGLFISTSGQGPGIGWCLKTCKLLPEAAGFQIPAAASGSGQISSREMVVRLDTSLQTFEQMWKKKKDHGLSLVLFKAQILAGER